MLKASDLQLFISFAEESDADRRKAIVFLLIPVLIEKHESELHDDMKKHYAKCGSYFGKQGLDVAYKMLMESTRIDRKPIAEYIHNITGEKVETLMNR